MSNEVEQKALASYLEDHNLKHTKQREAILDVFLEVTGHITAKTLSSACASCIRASASRRSIAR